LGSYRHSFTYFYSLPFTYFHSHTSTHPNGDAISIACTYFNANRYGRPRGFDTIAAVHRFGVRKVES